MDAIIGVRPDRAHERRLIELLVDDVRGGGFGESIVDERESVLCDRDEQHVHVDLLEVRADVDTAILDRVLHIRTSPASSTDAQQPDDVLRKGGHAVIHRQGDPKGFLQIIVGRSLFHRFEAPSGYLVPVQDHAWMAPLDPLDDVVNSELQHGYQ